jgi:hypothetical protein
MQIPYGRDAWAKHNYFGGCPKLGRNPHAARSFKLVRICIDEFSVTTGDSCKGGREGTEISPPLVILTEEGGGAHRFRHD